MNRGLLADAAPGRVLLFATLIPALSVPLVIAAWMKYYGIFVGDVEISLLGSSSERQLNPKWFLPIAGVVSLVGYLAVASFALALSRRLSLQARNAITLLLVPVYLVAMWLFVRTKS